MKDQFLAGDLVLFDTEKKIHEVLRVEDDIPVVKRWNCVCATHPSKLSRPALAVGMWVRVWDTVKIRILRIGSVTSDRIEFDAFGSSRSATWTKQRCGWSARPGYWRPVVGPKAQPAGGVTVWGTRVLKRGKDCPGCPSWRPQGPCAKCKAALLAPHEPEAERKRDLVAHVLVEDQGPEPLPGWDRCKNGTVYVRDDITRVEECQIRGTWDVYQQCFDDGFPNGVLASSGGFSDAASACKWADRHLPKSLNDR